MSKSDPQPPVEEEVAAEEEGGGDSMADRINDWMRTEGAWWASSFVFHMLLMCVMMLIGTAVKPPEGEAPSFDEATVEDERNAPKLERFEIAETPEEPTELNTDTLTLEAPGKAAVEEEINDNSPVFEHKGGGMPTTATGPSLGGLGGFEVRGVGPGSAIGSRGGGVGVGVGTGASPGSGGGGSGFGGIGRGMRKAQVGRFGGTKQSERSVAGALNWLSRHQSADGRWSLDGYKTRCTDASCTGPGDEKNCDMAATAMALLPFLAAGQTHESKGPYQRSIYSGLFWMMKNQKPDGDLRGGFTMYAHGLAAICMCEAYGLSKDQTVGKAAQAAIRFIENSQCPADGGWRYTPGQAGDTSVVGWQVMALKSGLMAGLSVNPKTLDGAKRFLKSVSSGAYGGKFGYTSPGEGPAMTAVGLLCCQYMGVGPNDPLMNEGVQYLMARTADKSGRNLYYWYYATQVMHNVPGENWDNWNRKMRRALIDTQEKEGCAAGSWDPEKPSKDGHGSRAGRLYMTSLSALTLEVYYRYLPLYQLDKEKGGGGAGGGGEGLHEAVKAAKTDAKKDAKAPEAKKEAKAPEAKKEAKKDAKK